MKIFYRKQCLGMIGIVLSLVMGALTAQSAQIHPGNGDLVEDNIFTALQERYQGRLQKIEGGVDAESYLQLLVTFEKHQLPSIIVVVNVLDRSIDKINNEVTANIIQIQVFPQIEPLLLEERGKYLEAIAEWQHSYILPQRVYLTPENQLVYGWGLPVYDKGYLETETLAQIIDEQASLWTDFGGFLHKKVGGLRPLVVAEDPVAPASSSEDKEVTALPVVEEPVLEKTVEKIEEVEQVVKSQVTPDYTIVETLLMLSGGRGLRAESQKKLTAFIENNQGNSTQKIIIRGYVASDKDSKENQLFSRKRAERVVKMMLDGGVSSHRVSAKGMGIQNPVASNTTSKGRDQNRRVEILLQK